MRIKRLSLRNIASIESADIDFEKGLNDPVTGKPASTFLIYGDTGAGKSVILDGIALALYKTTPRIVSVEGKINNDFTNANGESVSLTSLNQYVRLGISPNDECYSEVLFEDKKGNEYCAKLELGITLGNTNSKGIRPIKYSTPKWLLKTGNNDWSNVSAKSGDPVCDAIGLTYDQFSRMAMLAQGQFASFLTGDRKEREKILEKLTSTEKFSKYGQAISSLTSTAKEEKGNAEAVCETIGEVLKSDEELTQLNDKKKILQSEKEEKEKGKTLLDTKIKNIKAIRTSEGDIETAKENLKKLEKDYIQLYSDLRYRETLLTELKKELKEPEQWLDARESKRPLYENAGEVKAKLDNLKTNLENRTNATTKKEKLEGKTENLKKELEGKTNDETAAKKALNEKTEQIKQLTEQRNNLNPDKTNADLRAANTRQNNLDNLKHDIEQLNNDITAANDKESEIKKAEEKLNGELTQKKETAESAWETAVKADRNALNLLNTMKMSVEDTLVNLRKRLADEHTETCPLCGQHISQLHIDEDFKKLVTPLEEEQKKTAKALETATLQKGAATDEFNNASNELSTLKGQHDAALKENEKKKNKLNKIATGLGLNATIDLLPQIDTMQKRVEEEIGKLNETIIQANKFQQEIDELNNDKTLEKNLQKATQEKNDAANAWTSNNDNIQHQDDIITSANNTINPLLRELHPNLDDIYADWLNDIDGTRNKLEQEAEEYNKKKKQFEQDCSKKEGLSKDIENFSNTREQVLEQCPKWNSINVAPQQYSCNNIQNQWTELYGGCRDNKGKIISAENTIKEKLNELGLTDSSNLPDINELKRQSEQLSEDIQELNQKIGGIDGVLDEHNKNLTKQTEARRKLNEATNRYNKWDQLNKVFGGDRFRTLVQSHILKPLLNNANLYLARITDRYTLTCSNDNKQLSILVLDNYNQGEIRSTTVLSGGERFMISLALSLALSSLNHPDLNVDILFIDEGFGTLDEKSLHSVMCTLEKLQEIAGQSNRRVGIISHREELEDIPVQIRVSKNGQGRSTVAIKFKEFDRV